MPKREQSGPQVPGLVFASTPQLPKSEVSKYATWRAMRKDPTIALARQLSIAPVLASNWSVESENTAPEGAVDLINKTLLPLRIHIVRTGMLGCIDFGWQGYETVMGLDDDSRVVLKKLKPLLQDTTDILIKPETGQYDGLRLYWPSQLDLRVQETLLLNIDVEGTNWYGQSVMSIAEEPYDRWSAVDDAAKRYDNKIAGSHWVVHYPAGTSEYNGEDTENWKIARTLLQGLEAAGGVVIPKQIERITGDISNNTEDSWSIELISDKGAGSTSFSERQKYLDALKVRAFGLPERAILEGQFGTKAEAEAHADLAILNMELRHQMVCQSINWHIVNRLLKYNYGPGFDDTVYIDPAPIADLALSFLRQLIMALITSPESFSEILEDLDIEALQDRLGLPIKPGSSVDAPGTVPGVRGVEHDSGIEDLLPLESIG